MKNLFTLIFVVAAISLQAQSNLIGKDLLYFQDTTAQLTVDQVLGMSDQFQLSEVDIPNLGVTLSAHWFKLQTNNQDGQNRILEIAQPTLDQIDFYQLKGNEIEKITTLGEVVPWGEREFKTQNYWFEVEPNTNYLIRIKSDDGILLPMYIASINEMHEKQSSKDLINGLYFGIMLVMLLYNIFLFISTKYRSYFYYVFYLLMVMVMQAIFQGYAFRFLWPDNTWLATTTVFLFSCFVPISAMIFMQVFIRTKANTPKLHFGLLVFIVIYSIAALLSVFGINNLSQNIIQAIAGSAIYTLIVAIVVGFKGVREARFFVIAWAIFLMSVVVWFMKDFGVLPYNDFTNHSLQIGSAIEVILLSFALADRINQLKAEKEQEQNEKILAIQENEKIITQQNVILEQRVEERTAELESSNTELQNTLTELQTTQSQLVDAEKMASLGQMTAGIAHELNNPINFVSSNISPLKRDIEDILDVLDKYEDLESGENGVSAKIKEIEEYKEEIDLDYTKTEIGQLLEGIHDGAHRTAEIVKGLRVFSRLDEDALKSADLNECLRSTLVIVKSSVDPEVTLTTDLDDNIPEINCFPGKLNQVFMNIITNAAQATVDPKNTKDKKEVSIKTSFDDQNVYVSIADTGIGIPDSIKQKIFDPFFTTKDVGSGTGLGLSIVLGIINDHKGTIEVKTEEGQGTEFLLTLSRTL